MIYTCTADSELQAWLFGFAAGVAPAVVLIGTARIRAAWRNLRADLRKQQRTKLAAMWVRLADRHRTGKATDDTVFATLTGLRPDIHPHRRWDLYDALDTALHVARRIAEDDGAHRDLGMSPQEAEEYAAGRVTEALDDLIGGER